MIAQQTVDSVKAIPILSVIEKYVVLKKKGADSIGLCPFHKEKTPSFTVSPAKSLYKCFGCGRSGDSISFIMEHERKSYPETIELIAHNHNIAIEKDAVVKYEKPLPRLEILKPQTIKYFEGRGISNNTTLRLKITESIEWMPKADNKVPVICFNYYRGETLVNIKYRAKDKDFKLSKNSELIFYNLNALQGETVGVIVEGEPDVCACVESGVYNTISVPNGANDKGTINLSYLDNSWNEIKHIEKWIIFTDNDEPGIRLRDELCLRFGKSNCFIVTAPSDCKDANDVLLKHGAEKLRYIISMPEPAIQPVGKSTSFPFHIFGEEIHQSMVELAYELSLPIDFLGMSTIFTIAALSGNMYSCHKVNIKNIIYGMLIGPTGLGKSPAFDAVCGSIVAPLEQKLFDDWKRAYKEWYDERNDARHSKPVQSFKKPKPERRTRTAKGGTVEGIMAHSMNSPAGFGLYFDEGGKMLSGPNQFKKDTSSVDFWNEIWNGNYFNELRSDSDRERFASNSRVSVLMGMQTDRIKNYFTKDATDSGLTYRFLFTQSNHIHLNEEVDHFSEKRKPCDRWVSIVTHLFNKGAYDFFKDDNPINVTFTETAALMYNQISGNLIQASNELKNSRKIGDADEMLIGYESKLYSYFGRFMMIIAICRNVYEPVIDEECVDGALQLYEYFRDQARILFMRLSADNESDLSENERLMYESLPDRVFERADIDKVAKDLKMSEKFFDTAFRRKYKNGFIKKLGKGKYQKE